MEGKKMAPPPHQHPARPLQPHPLPNHGENHYSDSPQYTQVMQQPPHHINPNTVIHQPPTRPQHPQSIGPRSPLLENHQDLYGTRQPTELARQYALREQQQQQQLANQRLEHQQRSVPMVNSSYSLQQSPSSDPILTAPVPPGYNASVHQAYLRRNQHQLGADHQQIYQNHQSIYQPASQQQQQRVEQQRAEQRAEHQRAEQQRIYQPYTSRIQQPTYMSSGHSHTQLLRQQYNDLQQMKLQQQMQYQSQAQIQQQQTFAQRQILHQHAHSRQQSQQNLSQYGTSPSTAQLNEVNARLSSAKKHAAMISPDEYANHPANKMSQNQAKQSSVSPVSKTSDPLSSPSTKSPSGSESRRSSSGTSQALRSPIAQRPPAAPVTKAGWLYKQGSDGLKVWRKRWFVLSEYCLFYYKGQEEDKLLGSVLLPSYVVSLCTGDEKGLRKWSFKCEHANMRTYVLAAPDQSSMDHWVRVLTMAALMQDGSVMEKIQQQSVNHPSSSKERRSKTPINSGDQDDTVPETSGGIQHMYENAPPKPRRSNEGYQSPSPERADRYDPNYDILREPSAHSAEQKLMKNRLSTKSPIHTNAEAIYESKSASSNYATQRNLTKSPEAIYNAHNLSLPLTNMHTNLDNNKSPMNVQSSMPNRGNHSNENRLSQNKSPAYFENKSTPQTIMQKQEYQLDNQNIYVESGYQKMLQQQEMNKRMIEREQERINQEQGPMPGHSQNMNRANPNSSHVERQSFERRTPDTYGRSMIVPGYYSKGRSGDYEDVYNNPSNSQSYSREQSYRRPMSPVAYEDKSTPVQQLPHQRYAQTNVDNNQQIYQAPPVQMRQKKLPHNYTAPALPHNNVPRPHSADFLEYEAKNPSYDPNVPTRHANPTSRQPQRPKSSLDINSHNDYNGDNYYYSEASYAEKMRQSAHYLRNKNFGSTNFNPRQNDPKSPDYVKERKMSMPSFRGEETNYESEMRIDRESIYGIRDQNRNVNPNEKYGHSEVTGPNSNWTLRNKSLSQIMTQDDVYNRSNSAMSEGSTVSGFIRDSAQMVNGSGDQFMRSASARLPSTGSDQLSSREGGKVQQREESMKRLLEWKQRMLQSPLTRKPTPATLSLARSLPPGPSQRQTLPKVSARLHNQIQPSYNSYSSDDEERLGDVVGAAGDAASPSGQGQAGRSITPSPPSSPLPPPPPELQPSTPPQPNKSPNSDYHAPSLSHQCQMEEPPSSDTMTATSLSTVIDIPQSPIDSDTESEMQLEYTDNDLDEILAISDDNDDTLIEDNTSGRKSVMQCFPHNPNERSAREERDSMIQRFPDYEICEMTQSSGISDVKDSDSLINIKIRSKASTPKPETPPNEEDHHFEDHYLPMSPRKAVLSTEPAHTEIIKNISVFGSVQHHEDNPYVEMSQGIGIENAFLNEEMQAYEVVCVSTGKVEPVYMELNHLPDKNILDDKNSSTSTLADSIKDVRPSVPSLPPPKSILRKQNSESKLSIKSSSRLDVKSPLPDILMNSQGKNSSLKSESSDADDEGSKDMSLNAFSRFSISDSFRPASYYLGSSGILAEAQDSSDSELVSPPPIPTSPPPMEELNMSLQNTLHKAKSEETLDDNRIRTGTGKKSTLMVYGNTPSMYDTIFKGERIKRNRASMPDSDRKYKDAKQMEINKRSSLDSKFIPPSYRTSGNNDTDSLVSYNADRGSSRMSLESDISSKFDASVSGSTTNLGERQSANMSSDKTSMHDQEEFIELRHSHQPTDSEIERMLKRRPLSEESCIEIESLDSNYNENMDDVNLDQYLDELQASNVYLYANTMYPGMKSTGNYFQDSRPLDMATVGYLNDRVAAIREEVHYENIQLMEGSVERSRSRNSNMSNTTSDPDTVNTFQTVRPVSRMSNASGISGTSLTVKSSSLSVRSASRNSLPTESNLNTSSSSNYNNPPINHTRHASYEQPTISYYSKNTPYFENEAAILKNLNQSLHHTNSPNKVNISEMTKTKSPKSPDNSFSEVQPKATQPVISHSREGSLEQSAPYYYSDLSSQDNLNITASSSQYPPTFNKNNFAFNSKLNNQRRKGPLGKKCDISHIQNPIHSNSNYNQFLEPGEGPIQIAAAARCVSVEFLSAADKFTDIDNKNLYESDTLKKKKVRDSMPSLHSNNVSSKNIYLSSRDKTNSTEVNMTLFGQHLEEVNINERNKSLERILHNAVRSGNSAVSRLSESNRSRSQSALSEVAESHTQPSVSNRFQEIREAQSIANCQINNRKPVNSNLYVEVGSSSSNANTSFREADVEEATGNTCDGEMLWDEDSLWRDNLRRVSQRHARSLDHLDCLVSPSGASGRRSVDLKTMLKSSEGTLESDCKIKGKLSREVKYVNDNVKSQRPLSSKRRPYKKNIRKPALKLVMIDQSNENDVYVQLASESVGVEMIEHNDDGVYEQLSTDAQRESLLTAKEKEAEESGNKGVEEVNDKGSDVRKKFEIDREKLRQWDLMSSGEGCGGEGEASSTPTTTASMSASITGVENSIGKRQSLVSAGSSSRGAAIPVRAVSPRVRPSGDQGGWSGNDSDSLWASQIIAQTVNQEENWSTSRSPSRQSNNQPIRAVSPRVRRASDVEERPPPVPSIPPPESPTGLQHSLQGSVPDLSAGELLGRTHEELVLLLIQLRRRHSSTASSIEQCCTEIHTIQSRLSTDESTEHRHDNLQRLESLRRHLSDLERHYTKSKPLVHLVDNMVKLGALYNRGPTTIDRLEQSQLLRERALLEQAQEQRRWAESSDSLSREQVEQRVEQLRAMERSVAGEAQTLRGLRRERETLQRALGGAHLQQDLSRVHAMLAINSKKLEQTVAGNARLEQELAVLRQKLQGQHMGHNGKGDTPNDSTDTRSAVDATAMLEDELKRVQHLVGDLQKQRQELSVAVRQLTDKSQSIGLSSSNSNIPATVNDFNDSNGYTDAKNKQRFNPAWAETDLDNEEAEQGSCSPTRSMAPLYIDIHSEQQQQRAPSPDQSDDLALNSAFANLSSVEKQEIKTVRIVKRESERRQRDRERSSLPPGNAEWSAHHAAGTLDQLLEEDSMAQYSSRSTSLPRGFQANQPQYQPMYNPNAAYQQEQARQYLYQTDSTPTYQHRSHANPPNTLSLTNVNNPFDNMMSTSSASINNKFVSSPSLINNNEYGTNHQDAMQMPHSKYGYQKSAPILPLPVTSNNYSLSKHSMSHSGPYMDGSMSEIHRMSYSNGIMSPGLSKTASINSLTKGSAELSPVFTSEAARQIIIEMAGEKNGIVKSNGSQHRRQVPKEKRRHYTAPHHLSAKALDQTNGDDFFYQEKWYRARDDVDMERVLRGGAKSSRGPPPLAAPPDVVRSTLPAPHTDHYSEHTIDRLLAAPNKIFIPERYVPEQAPELSPEEQKKRMEKVESIKKMLSSTTPSGDPSKSPDDNDKRHREHLLQLNQMLAKQVMEMSKIVAVKALQSQATEGESSYDSEDLSPDVELPLYQQRDNFFT